MSLLSACMLGIHVCKDDGPDRIDNKLYALYFAFFSLQMY